MDSLPRSEQALVLRTDFSDDSLWKELCQEIQRPVGPWNFQAQVSCLNDPQYEGLGVEQLLALDPQASQHYFIFLADQTTFNHPEHPIMVVDLSDQPGRTFRVIPSAMWAVENNLSLANMDFFEFADHADQDGIFRGF